LCYIVVMQTQTKFVSFRISVETYDALGAIKDRDGIPLSVQMRRALALWLEQKAVAPVVKKGKR